MSERGSIFFRAHRSLGSGLRWDVFWHSVRRRDLRLAFGFLIWPAGWSHTRLPASTTGDSGAVQDSVSGVVQP